MSHLCVKLFPHDEVPKVMLEGEWPEADGNGSRMVLHRFDCDAPRICDDAFFEPPAEVRRTLRLYEWEINGGVTFWHRGPVLWEHDRPYVDV